ncbi:MAG: hypothetical protein KDC95_14220 [Planctomycetes bacterium]|nr:hypothetical protein [Planctomycetota bacterium]
MNRTALCFACAFLCAGFIKTTPLEGENSVLLSAPTASAVTTIAPLAGGSIIGAGRAIRSSTSDLRAAPGREGSNGRAASEPLVPGGGSIHGGG